MFLRFIFTAVFCSQFLWIFCANTDVVSKTIVFKNVERTIDATTQLVKVSTKITVENTDKEVAKTFLFSIDATQKPKLAHTTAQLSDTKATVTLSDTKVAEHKGQPFWRVELPEGLQPGQKKTIQIDQVFAGLLTPHPVQITQKEKQLVILSGNHYVHSPYLVESQSTKVLLAGPVESYSKLKPVSQADTTITYGPYTNLAPFANDPLSIHYENNSPFLSIRKLHRVIELSHWGNIAIEEKLEVYHTGALLKGSFSRYEYQREATSGISSVKSFKTLLPASALDVYYRDDIGNISTSHVRALDEAVEIELRPRFPLFGGWKTEYTLGYNVPSYEYLYNQGDDFLLDMRFIDHIFDDMIVEEAVVVIILPEGSTSIKIIPPYPVKRLPDTVHYTYLDTAGRPTITLRKRNLVENHISNFKLKYRFPRILMLQEPLLVVVAFYILFILVIIYVRLDFSIDKDEDSDIKQQAASCVESLLHLQDRRAAVYQSYDQQIAKLKSSKDTNGFQNGVKTVSADHKTSSQAVSDLLLKVKSDAPELAEKTTELQKLDKGLWDLYQQHGQYVERLVNGRLGKQQFVELESQLIKKKEETVEKINITIRTL